MIIINEEKDVENVNLDNKIIHHHHKYRNIQEFHRIFRSIDL